MRRGWGFGRARSGVDDDGFGKAVLGALAIAVPEELEEAEAELEDGGAVAEGSLDGLPAAEAGAGERNGAGAGDPFAGSAAVAEIVGEAPIENGDDNVAGFVEIPVEVDFVLVANEVAEAAFERSPDEDGKEEIDDVAEDALGEGGEEDAVELVGAGGFVRVETAARALFRVAGLGGHLRTV